MFRRQDIITLLGLVVAAAWPMASEAKTCASNQVHKIAQIGGSNVHSCISTSTGSVLLDARTDIDLGAATLTVKPCTDGECDGGGGETTTSAASTSEMAGALIACRNRGGFWPPGVNPGEAPAVFPVLFNIKSTTENLGTEIRTTLTVALTATQLTELEPFCPPGLTPTGYIPIGFGGVLEFETGDTFLLDATGGPCTVDPNAVTVNRRTGAFSVIAYAGGCSPAAGNEFPFEQK